MGKRRRMTADEMEKKARQFEYQHSRGGAIDRHPLKEQIMECLRRDVQTTAIARLLKAEKMPELSPGALKHARHLVLQERAKKGKV